VIRLFTTGGLLIDNVVSADGVVARRVMGGNAVYSAAGAGLWMNGVGIVGVVPRNYPADWIAQLGAAGIDISGISVVGEAVARSEWFFYRPDGSRADHLHARLDLEVPDRLDAEAAAALEARLRAAPDEGDDFGSFRRRNPVRPCHVPERYQAARAIHLAPNLPGAQQALMAAFVGGGRLVTLDPGPHAAAIAVAGLADLTAFLPSERELEILAPGCDPAAALGRLLRSGIGLCVGKLGGAGSMLCWAGGLWTVPPVAVVARDPTGAGDAYCGGFLAGLLLTGDPLRAACCGTVSASFAVESFGPLSLLRAPRAEAERRLATIHATKLLGTVHANC
jgi:ribokinase